MKVTSTIQKNKIEDIMYITQLIYIKQGEEATFDQFESVAIPIIANYNGKLFFRLRPSQTDFIELNMDKPYEIHLIEFKSELGFQNFMQDEERKRFLRLKEESIKLSILIKGKKL